MAKWKTRWPILGLAIVCLVAAIYTVRMPAQEVQQPLPTTVPDLAAVSRVEVSENGTVVLAGQFGPEEDDGDEVKREAKLAASAGEGEGEAEVELDAGDRSRQELEVDVERLKASTTYQVLVDGQMAGTLTTDARGKGSLELSRNTNQQ
jgi:hypothetical protein